MATAVENRFDPPICVRTLPSRPALVRASALPAAIQPSQTLTSFCRFIGDRPFTLSDRFVSLMEELDRERVSWISTLDDADTVAGLWSLDGVAAGATCLTMGPLEGALEWRLADMGATKIVSIEGNRANYLKCQLLKTIFPDLPIEFIEGNVLTVDLAQEFDVVFCPGVLYHVNDPQTLLDRIKSLRPRLVFISTQLAVERTHPASEFRQLKGDAEIEFRGRIYRGRLFSEGRSKYLSGTDRALPSTWLFPADLLRLMRDLGFHIQDHYVIDLGALGVCGAYVCSIPEFHPSVSFRVGVRRRLKRWVGGRIAIAQQRRPERLLEKWKLRG